MDTKLQQEVKVFLSSGKVAARRDQIVRFRPIAKEILQSLVSKEEITDEDLTGLIHLFRPNPVPREMAERYLAHIVTDPSKAHILADRLIATGLGGFTAPGRLRIHSHLPKQLRPVRDLLKAAFTVKTPMEAALCCREYEGHNVRFVTAGIYSPWLHYINPEFFPILNGPTRSFFRSQGVPTNYPDLVERVPQLAETLGLKDYGLLDSFVWNHSNEVQTDPKDGSWRKAKWIKKISRRAWDMYFSACKEVIEHFELDAGSSALAMNIHDNAHDGVVMNLANRATIAMHDTNPTQVFLMLPKGATKRLLGKDILNTFVFSRPDNAEGTRITTSVFEGRYGNLLPVVIEAADELLSRSESSPYRKHHIPDLFRMATDVGFKAKALDYLLDGKGEWPGNNELNNMDHNVRYWAAGFGTDSGNTDLESFKSENYWQALRYSNDDDSSTANEARRLFAEIAPNDFFLIKGYGGQHDLKVHYVGRVRSVDKELKRINLAPTKTVLYNGKAPRGPGAGNWYNTILEVTRPEDIELLFAVSPSHEASAPDFVHEHNRILFGPPGTGKTYSSASYAVAVVEGINPERVLAECETREGRTRVLERYRSYRADGRIAMMTFHQSFSYEDFVEGIKPTLGTSDGDVQYELKDGLFKRMCEAARDNWISAGEETQGLVPFDEAFGRLVEKWEEDPSLTFPMQTQGYEFTITGFTEHSIRFRKASGGEGHTLSKGTLQEIYYGRKELRSGGLGNYYPGVINRMKELSTAPGSLAEEKRFVLVIDEINRGNVSGIFGELITLLEPDKRLGASEELLVKLPYSKDRDFGVPPNLYVIGTMNTADRSVEALDTALRRRFSFVEVQSRPELVQQPEGFAVKLQPLLAAVNGRIERLLDKDHQIGHSYFMGIQEAEDPEHALRLVFKNKLLPLLQEYFYGDPRKIGAVLGPQWVKKREASRHKLFGKFDLDDAGKDVFDVVDPTDAGLDDFVSIYA